MLSMSLLTRLMALSSLLLVMSVQLDARPSARPSVSDLESWPSIRGSSICRTRVIFNKPLQLHEAWCDDGVEGQEFEASGELFTCRTTRLTVPFEDSDVDVAAGCAAVRERRPSFAWMEEA